MADGMMPSDGQKKAKILKHHCGTINVLTASLANVIVWNNRIHELVCSYHKENNETYGENREKNGYTKHELKMYIITTEGSSSSCVVDYICGEVRSTIML